MSGRAFGPCLVLLLSLSVTLACEKKVDDKTRYCRKLHEYHLHIILERDHVDKFDRVCCAGFELIDCILESGNDTNCTEVSEDLAAPARVFSRFPSCLNFTRQNCQNIVCKVSEFESLSERCYDTYNSNIIHVLEDPENYNKSGALCCELNARGHCVINAAAQTDCEGRPVDFRQAPGLTREYGDCDFFTQIACKASSLSHIALLAILCVFINLY